MFICFFFCNLFLIKKILTETNCYSAVDIVVSVIVYDVVVVYWNRIVKPVMTL